VSRFGGAEGLRRRMLVETSAIEEHVAGLKLATVTEKARGTAVDIQEITVS
jgi:hypothetical protein